MRFIPRALVALKNCRSPMFCDVLHILKVRALVRRVGIAVVTERRAPNVEGAKGNLGQPDQTRRQPASHRDRLYLTGKNGRIYI